jgi:predicted nuclease of restriction endonuclease-like (RecB) superfamily
MRGQSCSIPLVRRERLGYGEAISGASASANAVAPHGHWRGESLSGAKKRLTGESKGRSAGHPAVVRLGAELLGEIRSLILSARGRVAAQVNEELTLLYWSIGRRIQEKLLRSARADYGEEIVSSLGRQLGHEFGSGFSDKNLWHMIRFAEVFADERILSALRRQLSWTHFKRLIYIEDPLKRDFYAELCRVERWSTRTLEQKISGMLYERTALSRKPETLIRAELDALRDEDRLTPDLVFRDPYLLAFLGLKDRFLERDLEDAIIRELERFILELGVGFAFVARQMRISVDGDHFFLRGSFEMGPNGEWGEGPRTRMGSGFATV